MARDFTLEEFRRQCDKIERMRLPEVAGRLFRSARAADPRSTDTAKVVARFRGIIDAMTDEERRNPGVIDPSRRRRIAAGSGTEPHEVKQFLKQFEQVCTLVRQTTG